MLNRTIFLCVAALLLLLSEDLLAQRISYSSPQRLSGRNISVRILGETAESILIYRVGRRDDEVDVFGKDLRLKRTQDLSYNCNTCYPHRFVVMHDRVIVFVLEQERNFSVVHYREYNARMEPVSRLISLDTIRDSRDAVYDNLSISFSEDKSYIYYAHPYYENRELSSIFVSGFNRDMQFIYSSHLPYGGFAENADLASLTVSNEGDFYLALKGHDNIRRTRESGEYYFYGYNKSDQQLNSFFYVPDKPTFGRKIFRVDNFNQAYVATSLFEAERNDGPRGLGFARFDRDLNLITENYIDFPGSLIFELSGKDSVASQFHLLRTFNLYNVVLRYDGGFIAVAESRHDNTEAFRGSMVSPSMSPGYRSVNINYFNDIMVFSIDGQGNLDWTNVLRKKQVSEDDRGFFSSYVMMLTPDRLRFIFNEEIYIQTNINEYRINTQGESRRTNIFNSGERNVMLAPRLANQINANTVIIPSFRRNNFRLVKIEY